MKIQSLELLKNRYFNLLTHIDVNNTSNDILQILDRLTDLLNIDKAVENIIAIQSSNIISQERELSRYCKKIPIDNYTKYAFSYIKMNKNRIDTYYTNRLYLGYHNSNNTNNYFLFAITASGNIYIIYTLQTEQYEWAPLLWKYIDEFYNYIEANPNKNDYSDFKITNLSDNITVVNTNNSDIDLNNISSDYVLSQDPDFIIVHSKDSGKIISKINKINALIIKNTKYFKDLSFSESNLLLSNLINLRNLLLERKKIVINNNLTNNNIKQKKNIFDDATDFYKKLRTEHFIKNSALT